MRRDSEEVIAPSQLFSVRPWGPDWTAEQVIDLLEPMVVEPRRQRILEVLEHRLSSVTVLMDAPHDPHNGAAIMRSCDAFGISEVHVIPRAERFFASNVVSKGAERWVDVVEHPTPGAAATRLKDQGYELVCAHPEGELVPADLSGLPRVAILLGNEHDGISEELTQLAGRSVRIPMVGFVESLNVSVSGALLIHAATANRPGDLRPEDKRRLYAQGLYRTVKRAPEILAASTPH